jgi:hypothetical protein
MTLKLSEHRTALMNLRVTFRALDNINSLIKEYEKEVPGPAYVKFDHVRHIMDEHDNVQIDRKTMVIALKTERESLVQYLASLGIEA